MPVVIRASKTVENLAPYVAPLEGRRGLLRLDFNENTVGPSPRVVEAIRTLPPDAYATYPEYAGLDAAYAQHAGVGADQVASFNGADAAIRALFDAFGEVGAEVVTTTPTFGYYRPCAQLAQMTVREVPYEADLSFPREPLGGALASRPRLCVLCNPNNPTGTMVEPEWILQAARSAPETLFAVDEIYQPFTGRSVLPDAVDVPNVIALRSLSKGAGIAALRLGFACGNAHVIERLTRVTGPYDINMFAVVAARAALEDAQYMLDYARAVEVAKGFTCRELDRLGIRYFADGGNYVLVWPPGDVATVEGALRSRGVLVRSMGGKALIDGSFRLTIGTSEQMKQFFDAFTEVLAAG